MRLKILICLLVIPASSLWAQRAIRLVPFVGGLTMPTHITNAGDGSDRIFAVEQGGRVRIIKNRSLLTTPFLDIASKISCCNEQGLLSVAFPPGYATKNRFYASYTNTAGDSVISMFQTTSNPDIADPASEVILLTVDQPFANHNGGLITFGPDGFLYIGFGDGGSEGDPSGNGQNTNTLLGKLLRIDVESTPGTYRIPPTNPFVGVPNYRGEIWAMGLRNPWKYAFDRANGNLYIADVGQNQYEEVDFQPANSSGGQNYGWNVMEGMHCYNGSTCNMTGLTLPLTEYTHGPDCSVTGGYVYRGPGSPRLQGLYLYGDYCSGTIRSLVNNGGTWQSSVLLDTMNSISTFGEDEPGNLYVADYSRGIIFRITEGR
jgi:glucose/arabinose dehydrogenase